MMSTYHKDEMCVAINEVNQEERKPVVVITISILYHVDPLLGNVCEISKNTGAVTE
jgi:hypothetical protein